MIPFPHFVVDAARKDCLLYLRRFVSTVCCSVATSHMMSSGVVVDKNFWKSSGGVSASLCLGMRSLFSWPELVGLSVFLSFLNMVLHSSAAMVRFTIPAFLLDSCEVIELSDSYSVKSSS